MENHKKPIGISSFNCNGLANISKRNDIFTWLNDKSDIQIVCMQETHSNSENELQWRSGDIYFSHGLKNSRGVMILIKNNVDYICTPIRRVDGL